VAVSHNSATPVTGKAKKDGPDPHKVLPAVVKLESKPDGRAEAPGSAPPFKSMSMATIRPDLEELWQLTQIMKTPTWTPALQIFQVMAHLVELLLPWQWNEKSKPDQLDLSPRTMVIGEVWPVRDLSA